MSAEGYLRSTKPAISHLFAGLNEYDSLELPSIRDYINELGEVQMSKTEAKKFVGKYEDHFALEIARATLAGSLLQVAYFALKLHSSNKYISPKHQNFNVSENMAKFCVGREVHGIPIGLLIYAGRIQYNHWDEGTPYNKIAKSVFEHLYISYMDNPYFDMAYDLNYPGTRPISHYLVRIELKWKNYDDYLVDMKSLLMP